MAADAGNAADTFEVPASLKRKSKEPKKQIQFNVPLSWWEELTELSREFDQDVATFLREATEEWLRKARRVRQQAASGRRPHLVTFATPSGSNQHRRLPTVDVGKRPIEFTLADPAHVGVERPTRELL